MSTEQGDERTKQIIATIVGAFVYVVAAFLRSEIPRTFEANLFGHWVGSIDASLVYLITLASGFTAALLYRQHVFVTGFLAGAIGEIFHGIEKLLISSHAAGWILFPASYIEEIFINALPSGIGGAAGAAVAVVILNHRKR